MPANPTAETPAILGCLHLQDGASRWFAQCPGMQAKKWDQQDSAVTVFAKYQILRHFMRLLWQCHPFSKARKSSIVPWDLEGTVEKRCYLVSFPAASSGCVQDLLAQGPHGTGSQGASAHGCKAWSGEDWSTRPQTTQQEGEQLKLWVGSGFTGSWSVVCDVNWYFLPLGFSQIKYLAGAFLFPFL